MFLLNWSAKVEYLYYDLGSVNASVPLGGSSPLLYSSALLTTASFNGHIVRVGLNCHFNWGAPAPVVAKY
jgi:outer membrane immunogenic protein